MKETTQKETVGNAAKHAPIGVSIKNLTKVFTAKKGDFLAVNNVSLEVKPGQLVTLLGPSGCGKTTILRMLSGFTIPTDGTIEMGEEDMTNVPPNRRDVGMMFQSYALFPHLTVYENVAYGLRVKKLPKAELEMRVENILQMMQISDFRDRIPEKLSGGQQQRVALARAIVTEPKILLFDEPLSNLDAKMREYMRDEIRKLQQRLGITSVYVTHDQVEAMAISDMVVIMNKGIIEQTGNPFDIYARPNNKFVADFMGKANFTNGTVLGMEGERVLVETMGRKIPLNPNETFQVSKGDTVACMIRPEFLRVQKDGGYTGKVVRVTYLGAHVEYDVEIGSEKLTMIDTEVRQNGIYAMNEAIPLAIDEENIRLLRQE